MTLFDRLPYKVILASNSPRRRELLSSMGLIFELAPSLDIDESYPASIPTEEIPLYIARKKAEAHMPHLADDRLLITADTVVLAGKNFERVLGKPKDEQEAHDMLRLLSDSRHRVITGVTMTTRDRKVSFSDATDVEFMSLPDDELHEYVKKYRPFDKAGAYGIQEWIGLAGIRSINGNFYTVMGLPTHLVYENLRLFCPQ